MPHYRLHYFPESGNSYKLALMLRLCGVGFEPVWTDFGSGVTRSEAWRRDVNAMGEIPVLEEDGVKLTQTAPILLRLAERQGRYGGHGDEERSEILRWLFWDNQKLSGFAAMLRYRRAFTPHTDPAVMKFMRQRLDDFLSILEARLSTQAYVASERASVADLSMMAYLSYPANELGIDLDRSHPAIHGWLQRLATEPGWLPPYELLPGQRLQLYV